MWGYGNPDLFYDLITPESSGIRLDLDQRVFLRALSRFLSCYAVFPRGFGKTLIEFLSMVHTAIFFPDIELSMTAQTKENAVKILEEKYREVIRFYPLIANEVVKASFAKDSAEIVFRSGSRIDVLANSQTSKGLRRKRINVEESALLNNKLFEDALEPIVSVPRRTIGKLAAINPHELNGQIHFLSTAGYRGSDEWQRSITMVDEMADLQGKYVIGASWELAVNFGRGETRSQLLEKKRKLSPTSFNQNYASIWSGASDGALVDIQKVMDLRTLTTAELVGNDKDEYALAMDIARSQATSNNQSSIAVYKIKRAKNGNIIRIQLVNLISVPNGTNIMMQTVWLKRTRIKYRNVRIVCVDGNGVGTGIIDECLKDTIDPLTKESLGCWNTINTDNEPELEHAEEILFDLKAQGINHDIIFNFIDFIESGKLELLEKRTDNSYNIHDNEYVEQEVLPFVQTDLLLEEIANLKLKQTSHGKYTVEQVTKRIDKDRYSAVSYGAYVIKTMLDENNIEQEHSAIDYFFAN